MSLQTRLSSLISAIGADVKALRGVVSTASTATLTPAATARQYNVTAQNGAITIAAPTGSPVEGQSLIIRIKDNGTARAITWTTGSSGAFRAVGVTLPTTTVLSKVLYIGAMWNSAESRWDVLAINQEA